MRSLALLAAASLLALETPAPAQSINHSTMPGIKMPPKRAPATAKPKRSTKPPPVARAAAGSPAAASAGTQPAAKRAAPTDPGCPPEHAKMGHCTPSAPAIVAPEQADPHAGHDRSAMPAMELATTPMPSSAMQEHGRGGAALPAGRAPAPAAPEPTYADRVWGRDAMVASRQTLRREHGGDTFSQIMFNLAEYRVRDRRDGFRWDGEGWFGGDIDRLVIKSEGSGAFGDGVDDAEIQALYSRAIGPYFNLQAGLRHDLRPDPSRTYASLGVEGLAPYWFDVGATIFLSDKGDVLARLEGYYDQRITQRLILQPRAELNLALQDVPGNGIGSGLSDIELGVRLRYEIRREFAPYIGISYDRKVGDSARLARAQAEDVGGESIVLGVRAWF